MPRQFNITIKIDPTRSTSRYMVFIPARYSETGARQRRYFPTQEAAKGELQRLKARVEKHGTGAKVLGAVVEADAAAAIDILKAGGIEGARLQEIVAAYVKQHKARQESVSLLDNFNAYIKRLREDEKSDQHISAVEATSDNFLSLHKVMVSDITHTQIAEILERFSKTTHNLKRRHIAAVFNFGMEEGRDWLTSNPAEKIRTFALKLKEPEIYTPKQIAGFFTKCREIDPDLIPALTLMFFCGVRPDHNSGEITKVEWGHILLKDEMPRLEIPARIAKGGERRRTVTLRAPAVAWLNYWISNGGNPEGLVVERPGETFKKRLWAILRSEVKTDRPPKPGEKVQLEKRLKDGTRKSFASYVARSESKETAIRELGHSGGELLDRHYRTDVSEAEAKAFWNILPPAIEGATITHIKTA